MSNNPKYAPKPPPIDWPKEEPESNAWFFPTLMVIVAIFAMVFGALVQSTREKPVAKEPVAGSTATSTKQAIPPYVALNLPEGAVDVRYYGRGWVRFNLPEARNSIDGGRILMHVDADGRMSFIRYGDR